MTSQRPPLIGKPANTRDPQPTPPPQPVSDAQPTRPSGSLLITTLSVIVAVAALAYTSIVHKQLKETTVHLTEQATTLAAFNEHIASIDNRLTKLTLQNRPVAEQLLNLREDIQRMATVLTTRRAPTAKIDDSRLIELEARVKQLTQFIVSDAYSTTRKDVPAEEIPPLTIRDIPSEPALPTTIEPLRSRTFTPSEID